MFIVTQPKKQTLVLHPTWAPNEPAGVSTEPPTLLSLGLSPPDTPSPELIPKPTCDRTDYILIYVYHDTSGPSSPTIWYLALTPIPVLKSIP